MYRLGWVTESHLCIITLLGLHVYGMPAGSSTPRNSLRFFRELFFVHDERKSELETQVQRLRHVKRVTAGQWPSDRKADGLIVG